MRILDRTLVFVLFAVASGSAGSQALPGPPAGLYFVRNNTALELTCASRSSDGRWSSWIKIVPGSEWSVRDLESPNRHFYCRAPVRQVLYRIERAQRYSLLRDGAADEVRLRKITP